MTNPTPHPDIPTRAEREALNASLFAVGAETGFWDDNGHPAPWPDDIDEWTLVTSNPDNQPFY
jgi:hypothetical protein